MDYKKIWKQYYGNIPKDEQGRSYEIHHIDGNRNNNSIENLKCVSIQEHYDIHFRQKDWEACFLLGKRLNLNKEQLEELRGLGKKKPLLKCPHCRKVGGAPQMKQWHFDNCSIVRTFKKTKIKYKCSICGLEVGGRGNLIQHERSHFRAKNKIKNVKQLKKTNDTLICPHCNFEGKPHANLKRWHFDNCPSLTGQKRVFTEEHKQKLRKPKKKYEVS